VHTVLEGDLSVYTTIDLNEQVAAHEIAYGPSGYLPAADDPDLALVSIEPGTGRIKTMVGDRDENSQFNLVTQGRRQPGSSFKPFALIAALEQGIDPNTRYVSEKKEYKVDVGLDKPETWEVQNYDGIVRGEISLKEALWRSDNTVFADLAMNAGGRGLQNGPEKIADVARRCGITTHLPEHPKASIVLGAYEVSPLDMASAYATIANDGRKVEPTAISKVVSNEDDDDGKVLYVAPEHPEGKQVISEDIANEATGIMIGDVTEGIAKDAYLEDRPVAGKTGTSENFFDAWFIGFTPELVTGTWMGYAEGGQTLEYVLEYARKLHGLPGGITPAEIWKTYTQIIMRGEPIQQFDGVEKPEKVDHTAAPEPGAKNDPDDPRKRAPAGPGARERAPEPRRAAAPASASASSFAPSRARHSRARGVGAGRYRDAPTRASAALR
jgi:penicillin-binding protein 1A